MKMTREDVFSAEEFAERIARTRLVMQEREVDTLIVHHPSNIYYLCGHHTLNIWDYQCLVVPSSGTPFMVLWQFERGRFEASSTGCDAIFFANGESPLDGTLRALRERQADKGTIGLEASGGFLTPEVYMALEAELKPAKITNIFGVVENIRAIKSPAELDVMRLSQQGTDKAMLSALSVIKSGVDDRTIANAMISELVSAGTQSFSIFPMVAVGSRSGVPHHTQNGAIVKTGDTVFLECSPTIHWYNAPQMRTALVGKAPDPFIEELEGIGVEAMQAVIAAAKPGALASDVAMAGSKIIDRIRDKISFHDNFGYPVGIGFPPSWLVNSDVCILKSCHKPLEVGMTFHIPMTLRKYGEFCVGQSRTFAITENGCEDFSKLPMGLDRISS